MHRRHIHRIRNLREGVIPFTEHGFRVINAQSVEIIDYRLSEFLLEAYGQRRFVRVEQEAKLFNRNPLPKVFV